MICAGKTERERERKFNLSIQPALAYEDNDWFTFLTNLLVSDGVNWQFGTRSCACAKAYSEGDVATGHVCMTMIAHVLTLHMPTSFKVQPDRRPFAIGRKGRTRRCWALLRAAIWLQFPLDVVNFSL